MFLKILYWLFIGWWFMPCKKLWQRSAVGKLLVVALIILCGIIGAVSRDEEPAQSLEDNSSFSVSQEIKIEQEKTETIIETETPPAIVEDVQPTVEESISPSIEATPKTTSSTETSPIEETPIPSVEQVIYSTYILNTDSRKIHNSSCSSAEKISAENRDSFTGSIEDLLVQGYQPCQRCNPR